MIKIAFISALSSLLPKAFRFMEAQVGALFGGDERIQLRLFLLHYFIKPGLL